MILSGLSQQATDLGLNDPMVLISALANNLRDGLADGQNAGVPIQLPDGSILSPTGGTSDLLTAINTFRDGVQNVSGDDISSTVFFQFNPRTLTLKKSGNGSGTVTFSLGGSECDVDYSESSIHYGLNTPVDLTATAGSIFSGWSGVVCANGFITMTEPRNCTATFTLQAHTLTINRQGPGSGINF